MKTMDTLCESGSTYRPKLIENQPYVWISAMLCGSASLQPRVDPTNNSSLSRLYALHRYEGMVLGWNVGL